MVNKIFALSVVLYPILSAYIIYGPIDLGVFLCTILGVFVLLKNNVKSLRLPRLLLAFFIYTILAAIVVTHSFPLRLALYIILLALVCSFLNFDQIFCYYKRTSIVCILFFFVQEIMLIFTGVSISGVFSFLPTVYGDGTAAYFESHQEVVRQASFFLEPSYFAQFLLPWVIIELFAGGKKHIRTAIYISVVILFIRSGVGVLVMAISWFLWLLFANMRRRKKIGIVLFACVFLLLVFAISPEIVDSLLGRMNELSINGADERFQTSGFIRFFRGYYLYAGLPFINMVFGLNPSEINDFMMRNTMGLFDKDMSFINGVATILCQYGAIGLALFSFHMFSFIRKGSYVKSVLAVSIILILFAESYFICSRMLLAVGLCCTYPSLNSKNIS